MMYNIIQFLYQATIVLTALRCTYLAHLDLSFSPYTFPLQCRKRHSSVKFPSLSCYMAFCSPYSPILPSLFNVVKDISFYRKSWWFWLINFSFTMYVVTFHFKAKIHQNSLLISCCCILIYHCSHSPWRHTVSIPVLFSCSIGDMLILLDLF